MPPYLRVMELSPCSNGSKILFSISGSMPIPVSLTSKWSISPVAPSRRGHAARHLDPHGSRPVNFRALPNRLTSTWRRRVISARTADGDFRRHLGREPDSLMSSHRSESRDGLPKPGAQVEIDRFQLETSRPRFWKSRMSLITRSRTSAEPRAMLQVFRRFRGGSGAQSQIDHSRDAIHGSPDLMAHVRQELALGAIGGFGRFLKRSSLFELTADDLRLAAYTVAQHTHPHQHRQRHGSGHAKAVRQRGRLSTMTASQGRRYRLHPVTARGTIRATAMPSCWAVPLASISTEQTPVTRSLLPSSTKRATLPCALPRGRIAAKTKLPSDRIGLDPRRPGPLRSGGPRWRSVLRPGWR